MLLPFRVMPKSSIHNSVSPSTLKLALLPSTHVLVRHSCIVSMFLLDCFFSFLILIAFRVFIVCVCLHLCAYHSVLGVG